MNSNVINTKIKFLTEGDRNFFILNFNEPEILDLIEKFAAKHGTVWTKLYCPGAADIYLISDRGAVIQVNPPVALQRTTINGSINGYYLRVADSENYRRHSVQKLMGFSFKNLPAEVNKYPFDYQVVPLNGDPNNLNLTELYFVKKAGRNRLYTLSQVFEMRQFYATGAFTIAALAKTYGIAHYSMSKILNQKTWIVAEEKANDCLQKKASAANKC